MNRVEKLRAYIDSILLAIPDAEERRHGYVHLYGVSATCALLAGKRRMDVELAMMMGMLHDLHSYKTLDTENHAAHGAVLAREVLTALDSATEEEIDTICTAISHHSDKDVRHAQFDELLKDADVLQRYLYDCTITDAERLRIILTELDLVGIGTKTVN